MMPARKPWKKRGRLVTSILGGAVLVAALGATQISANLGYDAAEDDHRDALLIVAASQSDLRDADAALTGISSAAGSIIAGANEPLVVDPPLEEAVAEAVAEAEPLRTAAADLVALEAAPAGEKPFWFWELFGAAGELDRRHADAVELSDRMDAMSVQIAGASAAVTETGTALVVATGESATHFETRHVSARNHAVVALRAAAEDAVATTTMDENAVGTYTDLQKAAAQVAATARAELDEKSGPLMNARLEIEAFARSLAPGVLLEFDWAPIVNGAGDSGSMGGYTTWWWDDPGRATIELSNSVAEQWPAARSKALVAHEVGHAISVKCQGMYDASTSESIEDWATAWAISMGFTDDANGVWAYGYPPQNYIDAAAGCR